MKLTYLEDVRHFKKMMKVRMRIMSTTSTTLLGIDIFSTMAEIERPEIEVQSLGLLYSPSRVTFAVVMYVQGKPLKFT